MKKFNLLDHLASISVIASSDLICDPTKPSNVYRLTSLTLDVSSTKKNESGEGRVIDKKLDTITIERKELEVTCKELGLRTSWKSKKSVRNVVEKIVYKYQTDLQTKVDRKSSFAVTEFKFGKDLTLLNKNN